MKSYESIIKEWISNKRIRRNEEQLIEFFQKGFRLTKYPEKTYFGLSKQSISFIIGGIYLLACVCNGTEKGIWMLQDKIHEDLNVDMFEQHLVKIFSIK